MTPPKTIRVRIAVAVDEDGNWAAAGGSSDKDTEALGNAVDFCPGNGSHHTRCWVTADLPLPQVGEVSGQVEEAGRE